jgi:uncharacterized protein DUF5681
MQAPRRRGGAPWRTARAAPRWARAGRRCTPASQKGQSGNPGDRSAKSLPALLTAALNETVVVTIDGRRRKLTERQAIVTQMVDKSASADLRATKMLIDMMKDVEHKAGDAAPPPEPRRLAAADKEVVQLLVARLRRQMAQEIEEKAAEPPG